mmetsp:Transcript_85129/g.237556  ORF Transcript_85129/g.237556 Transcript_85129/m.237556 type:complete len:349 (-) Transcript_85129:1413-2459(-)
MFHTVIDSPDCTQSSSAYSTIALGVMTPRCNSEPRVISSRCPDARQNAKIHRTSDFAYLWASSSSVGRSLRSTFSWPSNILLRCVGVLEPFCITAVTNSSATSSKSQGSAGGSPSGSASVSTFVSVLMTALGFLSLGRMLSSCLNSSLTRSGTFDFLPSSSPAPVPGEAAGGDAVSPAGGALSPAGGTAVLSEGAAPSPAPSPASDGMAPSAEGQTVGEPPSLPTAVPSPASSSRRFFLCDSSCGAAGLFPSPSRPAPRSASSSSSMSKTSAPAPATGPTSTGKATPDLASSFSLQSSCFVSIFISLLQYLKTVRSSGSLMRARPTILTNSGFFCTGKSLAASGSGGM